MLENWVFENNWPLAHKNKILHKLQKNPPQELFYPIKKSSPHTQKKREIHRPPISLPRFFLLGKRALCSSPFYKFLAKPASHRLVVEFQAQVGKHNVSRKQA